MQTFPKKGLILQNFVFSQTFNPNLPIFLARLYCTEPFCAIRGYCTELFCAIRGYCTENLEQLATTRVLCNKLSWTLCDSLLHRTFCPQTLQGSETPSKWFASMWSLMPMLCPSFPHTLQILALPGPFGRRFWLVSIIDFTFSSSSCKSPDTKLGIAILRSLFGLCLSRLKSTTNV